MAAAALLCACGEAPTVPPRGKSAYVSPRDRFDSELKWLIGKDFRRLQAAPQSLVYKSLLVRTQPIDAGIENVYRLGFKAGVPPEQCIYVVIYDPRTFAIVSTRIEAGRSECIKAN